MEEERKADMKKKTLIAFILAALTVFSLAGCSNGKIEMSYYDMTNYEEGKTDATIDENIFYRNEWALEIADPSVYQAADGKFYVTGTTSSRNIDFYVSEDLVNWEYAGLAFDKTNPDSDTSRILNANVYAPEIIWDEEEEVYYCWFSSTPWNTSESSFYVPFVAKSKSPYGPYELIKFSDYEDVSDSAIADKIPERYGYFLSYSVFDTVKMYNAMVEKGESFGNIPIMSCIDFHPFVDPQTGAKYLYFSNNTAHCIMGIEMEDWLTPKYNTLTRLTRAGQVTADENSDTCLLETLGNLVNEGPWMNYRNGKYYLTLSINSFTDRSYQVIQAVADSPLGAFRKLQSSEGGMLLSTDDGMNDQVSGPGHHALLEVDGEMYIIYHKHDSVDAGGGRRHICVDRVKWVTIQDKDGNDLDVMYCNGPTCSVQPKPYFATGYENKALNATITATNVKEDSSVDYLNDDLLSVLRSANYDFVESYIKETQFNGSTKITMSFEDYETMSAIMIYQSKWKENSFYEIKRIEFFCVDDNGKEIVKFIDGLAFDWTAGTSSEDEDQLRVATAAIAEFNEIKCNKITIEIEPITKNQFYLASGELAVSEIVILGKGD